VFLKHESKCGGHSNDNLKGKNICIYLYSSVINFLLFFRVISRLFAGKIKNKKYENLRPNKNSKPQSSAGKTPHIFVCVIAFLAGVLPAFRASRLNPIEALRYE
jgi:hypothetical protein